MEDHKIIWNEGNDFQICIIRYAPGVNDNVKYGDPELTYSAWKNCHVGSKWNIYVCLEINMSFVKAGWRR